MELILIFPATLQVTLELQVEITPVPCARQRIAVRQVDNAIVRHDEVVLRGDIMLAQLDVAHHQQQADRAGAEHDELQRPQALIGEIELRFDGRKGKHQVNHQGDRERLAETPGHHRHDDKQHRDAGEQHRVEIALVMRQQHEGAARNHQQRDAEQVQRLRVGNRARGENHVERQQHENRAGIKVHWIERELDVEQGFDHQDPDDHNAHRNQAPARLLDRFLACETGQLGRIVTRARPHRT